MICPSLSEHEGCALWTSPQTDIQDGLGQMPHSCMRPNLAHPQPWPSKTGPAARLETLALSGRASQSAKCSYYYQFGVLELKHLPIVVGRLGGGRKYQGDQCGVLHFSQAGGVNTNIRTMNTCRRYIEDGRIPEYYSLSVTDIEPAITIYQREPTNMSNLQVYLDPCTVNSRKVLAGLDLMHVPYQFHHIDYFKAEQKSEAFTKINPHQTVPAATDGDLTLTESNAILMYAADLGGGDNSAYPKDLKLRADANRWLLWEASVWV